MRDEVCQPGPFERSYWVTPGKLLAGCYPGSPDLENAQGKLRRLVASGMRTVINLMERQETDYTGHAFVPYEHTLALLAQTIGTHVSVLRHPIRDQDIPTPQVMNAILGDIRASIERGAPVYVHCWGGRGRTGTVVGCYMLEEGLTTVSTVLGDIRKLRSNLPYQYSQQTSPETFAQQRFVLKWLSKSN